MFRRTVVRSLLLLIAVPAFATTIISRTASDPLWDWSGVQYVSWTQSDAYTNVSVEATLRSNIGGAPALGTAYLTNLIGSLATPANNVATPFSISIGNGSFAPISLFSGLTLGPGKYYLVISPAGGVTDTALRWAGKNPNTETLGAGVTSNQDGMVYNVGDFNAAYPPASTFGLKGRTLLFSVTGDAQIPEPATGAIVLAGLCGLALLRRRG